MNNKVQLIAYVDRISGGNLKDLNTLLLNELKGVFGGIHLLPFFDPIDGSDAGFDPVDHRNVDPRLGDWSDINAIATHTPIMADLIVNHMSSSSPQFKDFLALNEKSVYMDLFLTEKSIFPAGVSDAQLNQIYRPRPGAPFTTIKFDNGREEKFWTTFTSSQIDINVSTKSAEKYLDDIMKTYSDVGIRQIRLDAVGYAVKKADTNCFMISETFDFIKSLTEKAHFLGIEILVEIHSYYKDQIRIAKHVDYVYDFALPPLILHAIYNRTNKYLGRWLDIRPVNSITVLDTHDGIGVIDIGSNNADKCQKGLVPDDDIDALITEMHNRTNGTSALATGTAASNLDLYQVNSTFYDVLGCDDDLYLLARAIQFFVPGIPQVYYLGLSGEQNDMDLLIQTNIGREINRHKYEKGGFAKALQRPVAQRLLKLISIRNDNPAFHGEFSYRSVNQSLILKWHQNESVITLDVDFDKLSFKIESQFRDVSTMLEI